MTPVQVQQVATRVDPNLRVSWKLQFSSDELQDQFYEWMDQIPAVRWHPRLVFAIDLIYPLMLLGNRQCGWLDVLVELPSVILAGGRLALEMRGGSKHAQSIASTLYILCSVVIPLVTLLDNPCHASMGLVGTTSRVMTSPGMAAAFAALSLVVSHLFTPCTMRQLPCLCLIMLGNIASLYKQYLQHNGGLGFKSDPYFLGFGAISFSTVSSLVLALGLRFRLAKHLILTFLQSVEAHQRDAGHED